MKIYVVQEEHDGIPQEPVLYFDLAKAKESIDEYADAIDISHYLNEKEYDEYTEELRYWGAKDQPDFSVTNNDDWACRGWIIDV